MGVDIFLIVITCVVFILLFVASFYLLVNYQHPDDRNEAYVPKFVVIFGLVLAGATVLGLPLDVANNEGYAGCDGYDTNICGGLDMELFWNIFFWLIPIWIFVMIPFSSFYYEADDSAALAEMVGAKAPKKNRAKWLQAVCNLTVLLIIVSLLFVLTYLFLSDTTISVREYTGPVAIPTAGNSGVVFTIEASDSGTFDPLQQLSAVSSATDGVFARGVVEDLDMEEIVLQVDVATFYAGLMAWIGWFFFAIFCGVGLAALPLDMVMAFVHRPKYMNPEEFAEAKTSLQRRVNEMVEIGEQLKREREEKTKLSGGKGFSNYLSKDARNERNVFREFKAAAFLLEKDVTDFTAASSASENYNPLTPWLSLFGGMIAAIMSLIWLVHIGIYMLPPIPVHPFLNTYFEWFDSWFPLFGVLSVAIFSGYLLFCAVKGCFKFGLRFLCISLHPMVPGATYMSSFMFNLGLILLCALPCVQFCTQAFTDYARFSTIRQIFGVQIENLDFFGFFWQYNLFIFAMCAMWLLTSVYLWCKPQASHADGFALRDRLRRNQ